MHVRHKKASEGPFDMTPVPDSQVKWRLFLSFGHQRSSRRDAPAHGEGRLKCAHLRQRES